MELRPNTRNGLGPSIPELVCELRATFLTRDFDRVEHALLERESKLKSYIEEKDREIGFLKEKIEMARLDRINHESELKRLKREKHIKREESEEKLDFDVGNVCDNCKNYSEQKRELDDEKSVVAEPRKKNGDLEAERVELLEEKKKWLGEKGVIDVLREENKRLEQEKLRAEAAVDSWKRKFCELSERVERLESGPVNGKLMVDGGGGNIVKKEMDGIDGDGLRKSDEDFGISLRKLPVIPSKGGSASVRSGMRTVIEIQDSDEDECNLRGTLQREQTTPQLKGLPGGVNININLLDGLDTDTDTSSSSSSSLDMDNLPLSRKRMRT